MNALGHKSTSTLPKFCSNKIEWIIAVWNISSYKMSEKTKQNWPSSFLPSLLFAFCDWIQNVECPQYQYSVLN